MKMIHIEKKQQTAIEWFAKELKKRYKRNNAHLTISEWAENMIDKLAEQAKEMEKQQTVKFTEEFIERFTFGTYDGEVYQSKEISDYYNETYGSKGSDETNGNNVEEVPNVSNATEINWGGVVQHIPNICNCHQSNCHLINGKYICASCNKTLNVETQTIASTQIEISDDMIKEVGLRYCSNIEQQIGWYKAIEWYREQLKNKQ